MTQRKAPEVVEFKEPVYFDGISHKEASRRRRTFLEGNVFESPINVDEKSKKKDDGDNNDGVKLDIKETLREVQAFAFSNLKSRKVKRKREEEQLNALGAKASKSDYVPYSHYMNETKARKDKEKKIAEELNIPLKKKKHRKPTVRGKGRWKDSIKSLEPAMGKFRGGVLKLSKRDISKYS